MWILQLIEHGDIVELDIKVLVDGFQGAPDGDVVLEFYRDCCIVVSKKGLWSSSHGSVEYSSNEYCNLVGEAVRWFVRVLKKLCGNVRAVAAGCEVRNIT